MLKAVQVLNGKHAHRLARLSVRHHNGIAVGVQNLPALSIRQIVKRIRCSVLLCLLKRGQGEGAVPGVGNLSGIRVIQGEKAVAHNGVILLAPRLLQRCGAEIRDGGHHAGTAALGELLAVDTVYHPVH